MKKILYKQPHMYVRVINPEELLQGPGVGVVSNPDSGIPGDDADAKFNDFEDGNEFFNSDDIWED